MSVLDSAAAMEVVAGDIDLAKILIETCLIETPKIISQALDSIEKEDFGTARRCGHTLSSNFFNVGAKRAAEISRALEFCEGTSVDKFMQAVGSVQSAFDELKNAVSSRGS